MIPVYPDYEMRQHLEPGPEANTNIRNIRYEFITTLRVLHTDGRYYLQRHYYNFLPPPAPMKNDNHIKYFINQMYIATLFTKVDPNIVAPDGTQLFLLDPDQRSEMERLNLMP